MNDDMAAAHARDTIAEGAFRDCARQIDALLSEPRFQGRMSAATLTNLREARASLQREAAQIVKVWD